MAQQQRCPQGLGLIMVGTCSFAIRSVKNFLLRSVFFLEHTSTHAHTLLSSCSCCCGCFLCNFRLFSCVTSQRSEPSVWPRCSRFGPPARCSSRTPAWKNDPIEINQICEKYSCSNVSFCCDHLLKVLLDLSLLGVLGDAVDEQRALDLQDTQVTSC